MNRLFNVVMRAVSTLLGLLMVAIGMIWILQGLNVGPSAILQGFMAGNIQWALYGAILAVFGVGQVIWSNSRHPTV